MGNIRRTWALILIGIIAISCLSLLTFKPANAQTFPVPSGPQFTLKLTGPQFTQNTTYELNPDTGQIEPNIGYTNEYTHLVIVIKNQKFDSQYGSVYYNITLNGSPIGWPENQYPKQAAGSDTTEIPIDIFGQWGVSSLVGQQVTVQVQAMLGTLQWGRTAAFNSQHYYFYGTVGDLSNSQMISVPANTPLSTLLSPTQFSTILLIVIAALLAVIVALLLFIKKRKTTS